jgi:phosphatidylinositol kinase/protein kinase (PI-3  family)
MQVFVHNPLYQWEITAEKARRRQARGEAAGEQLHAGNADAGRAVARVAAKLRGVDFGEQEALSIQGQVEQLLLEATDAENLSKLYFGWAAWL